MEVALIHQNDTLSSVLEKHRKVLEEKLIVNKIFLTCLVKLQLLPARDILRLERLRTMKIKAAATLDVLVEGYQASDHAPVDGRLRFIDALRQTGQMGLVSELTDFSKEMQHIEAYQIRLEDQLHGIEQFLKQEGKKYKLPIEETFVVVKQKPKARKSQMTDGATYKNTPHHMPNNIDTTKKARELTRSNTLPVNIEKDVGIVEHLNRWKKENTSRKHSRLREPHRKGVFITSLANVYSSESERSDIENEEKQTDKAQGRQDKLTVYLQKAQHTTQDALKQLKKSKEVIEELHKSYDEAEHRNEELKQKLGGYEKRLHHIEETMAEQPVGGRDLKMIKSEKHKQKVDDTLCEQLLDSMMDEVKRRQTVLGKKVGPVPKENKALRLRKGQQVKVTKGYTDDTSELRKKLEDLASILNVYTQQEKLVTHKLGVAKRQKKVLHRHDEDTAKGGEGTDKEKKTGNTKSDENLEVTANDRAETERNICYKMMCSIEKQVKEKKQRLRLSNPRLRPTAIGEAKPSDKDREHGQSALTTKMGDLQSEIRQYIDIQHATAQFHREEHQKYQREYEQKLKASEKQVTLLQKQLQDVSKQAQKPAKKGRSEKGQRTTKQQNTKEQSPDQLSDKIFGNSTLAGSYSNDDSSIVDVSASSGLNKQTKYLDRFKQSKSNKKRALVRPMVRTLEMELPPEKPVGAK